ncbi:MAG: ATPase domain-containing protein, partial [Candidatus Bathyarchaeia archaeon]
MSKNSDAAQKKRTRDVIEETFARYEPKEETPPLPKISEPQPPRAPSIAEAPQEQLMTQTEPTEPQIVSTGISGVDAALGGGIPDHSVILICGEVGSNHDVFTQQILYNHTLENGKTAYYIAETLSVDIQQQMEQYNWTIKDAVNSQNWKFISMQTPDLQQLTQLYPKHLTEKNTLKLTPQLNTLKTDLQTKTKQGHWTTIELGHLLSTYDTKEITNLMLYWKATARTHGGIHFALLPTG